MCSYVMRNGVHKRVAICESLMSEKDRLKRLRGQGVIDRNGFPILDPPGARNRLPRRCHERLHKFKVTKSVDQNEYDAKSGKSLYKLEKVCVLCRHTDTEMRWV